MFDHVYNDVKEWAKKPYNENGTLWDWLLFIGVMTCGTILWTRVIRRLVD